MAKSLVLAFKTTDNRVCNIKVNNPKDGIPRAEIEAVMQDLIDRDVFETNTGASLAAIDSVYTFETNKREVLV